MYKAIALTILSITLPAPLFAIPVWDRIPRQPPVKPTTPFKPTVAFRERFLAKELQNIIRENSVMVPCTFVSPAIVTPPPTLYQSLVAFLGTPGSNRCDTSQNHSHQADAA